MAIIYQRRDGQSSWNRRSGRRTLSPPTNIFGLLYQGNGSALALTTVSAGSVLAAPVAYRELVGTATLNTIRSQFGTLMELANRHDLIVLCSNHQCRGLDSRRVLPNIHTDVGPDGPGNRAPVSRCYKVFSDSV